MPRKSNLVFSQQQEQELISYLTSKYTSVRENNADRVKYDIEAWERYKLDVDRRAGLANSIYPLSNIPIPVFALCVDNIACRIEQATNGDEPYIKFRAVGNEDEDKAKNYTDFFDWKLEMGGLHSALLDTQLPTVIQCAQISKATYDKDVIYWVDNDVPVLHSRETNSPVETITDGPIIQDEDEWVDQPDPIGIIGQMAGAMGFEQEPKMRKHLKSDPSLIFDPEKHFWKVPDGGIKRTQVVFSGAKSENVRYDRFFCDMEAKDIESSDVLELQDRDLNWFRGMWLERSWATWADYQSIIRTGNSTNKTNDVDQSLVLGQPTPIHKVENRNYDHVNPMRRVIECWCERDVLGNGTLPPQKFVAWLDLDLKVLISYEWQAKVCPDLKRPYTVCSLVKEPNRWCGESIWKRGKKIFDGIDRLFNGIFYRTLQQANPPKGGDPQAARDESTDIPYDPARYIELNKGRTIDEYLSYAKVPDTNQRSDSVMTFLINSVQLWLAVNNLQQGDYADVPKNNTATGIDSTLAESSIQRRSAIRRKLEADEAHVTKLVKIIIATIDRNKAEVYGFWDGDVRKSAEILGADVRTLDMHVTVVEQQKFREQDIARCKAALEVIAPYFSQLNKDVRAVMRPLILDILHQLGFRNVEKKLQEFEGMPLDSSFGGQLEMGPNGQPQLPQPEPPAASLNQPPPPPVKGSISVQAKLEQLPSHIQSQLLSELGVQDAAMPEETPAPKAPTPSPEQLAADKVNAAKKPAPTKK